MIGRGMSGRVQSRVGVRSRVRVRVRTQVAAAIMAHGCALQARVSDGFQVRYSIS